MKNKVALGALVLMVAAGIGGWYFSRISEENRYRVPTPTDVIDVAFSMVDMGGNMRSSTEWAGKARLINFWATWCAPCRREIPLLKKTQEEHGTNNVQVIGIAVDFLEEVNTYAQEVQFNSPILVGQEEAVAIAEKSGIEFIGLPFTMIVAPSGELIKAHVGEIFEPQIEQILAVFNDLDSGKIDAAGAREALGHF